MITTAQAAERLGVHRSRVHALIKAERLPAQRYGKVLLIEEKDLKLVTVRRPGRPPKKEPTARKPAARRTTKK